MNDQIEKSLIDDDNTKRSFDDFFNAGDESNNSHCYSEHIEESIQKMSCNGRTLIDIVIFMTA